MEVLSFRGKKKQLLSRVAWDENMSKKYFHAKEANTDADRLINESRELCNFVATASDKHQRSTSHHLASRAQSIRSYQEQLSQRIKDIIRETDLLLDSLHRSENALHMLSQVSYMNSNCLGYRSRRPAADLVRDSVEVELFREQELIQKSLELLAKIVQSTHHQLSANRDVKSHLEKDWSDKMENYDLEMANMELIHRPQESRFRLGCLAPKKSMVDESSWNESSYSNLVNADKEMELSGHQRATIGLFLSEMSKDLREGSDRISSALCRRIRELETSRRHLEDDRQQVLQKIVRLEDTIERMRDESRRQEVPMKVVQSRLHNRTIRPLQEIFDDSAQQRMKIEVKMLTESKASLSFKISEAQRKWNELVELRRQLEQDISFKEHSLFIDKEKCLPLRATFPDSVQLAGF